MISVKEFQNELKRWCIHYEECGKRINLFGGDNKARRHYENVLKDNPELEAQLVLIASNKDSDLRFELEERAAIRYAEGLSGDLFSAALSYIQR